MVTILAIPITCSLLSPPDLSPCFHPVPSTIQCPQNHHRGLEHKSNLLPSVLRTLPVSLQIKPKVLSYIVLSEWPFPTFLTLIFAPPPNFLNLDHSNLLSVLQTCQTRSHLRTSCLLCPLPKTWILQPRTVQLKCQFRKTSLTIPVQAACPSSGALSPYLLYFLCNLYYFITSWNSYLGYIY